MAMKLYTLDETCLENARAGLKQPFSPLQLALSHDEELGCLGCIPMIEAIVDAEIPVMGHLGLTPQSVHAMGGFKVQAKQADAAMQLVSDAKALVHAGCFAIVLEGVPTEVASMVSAAVDVPIIGIGAGPNVDGQVLVYHDVLGIEDRIAPKFVRRYADLKTASVQAIARYSEDVRSGAFPSEAESYHLSSEVAETLGLYGPPTE